MPRIRLEPIGKRVHYDTRALERELLKAIDSTTKDALGDFKKTTRTWDTKVLFEQVKAARNGPDLEGAAGTDNKIYLFVTRGTRAHLIAPKDKSALRFMTVYTPKTSVRVIGSHRGGSSGGWVSTKEPVKHPGTQAREFEEEIADRRQRTLENNVTAAILKATQPKS